MNVNVRMVDRYVWTMDGDVWTVDVDVWMVDIDVWTVDVDVMDSLMLEKSLGHPFLTILLWLHSTTQVQASSLQLDTRIVDPIIFITFIR
jgi:hypothetical protein